MFALTTYKSKRRLVQIISTILIVGLPFFNIMRLDVPTLRFYFFNTALWVDEFYLLFLVVMLILWIIVIFAMLYGRVWCGWMCPQTVLDELYYWFEKKTKRWFSVPKSGGKLWRRFASNGIVGLAVAIISAVIGFNLVAYFVDPYRMMEELAAFSQPGHDRHHSGNCRSHVRQYDVLAGKILCESVSVRYAAGGFYRFENTNRPVPDGTEQRMYRMQSMRS